MEADEAKRLALLAEADALIAADVPVVPLLGYASLSLVSPKLKGWQPNLVGRHPSRFLTLAP